jgi:hypothetical protein
MALQEEKESACFLSWVVGLKMMKMTVFHKFIYKFDG